MEKIYLYLMRRDKSKIKVLKILNGPKCSPRKVEEINDLGLSEETTENILEASKEHKMLWELWMESSKDFQTLRQSLKDRGIKSVPMHASPSNRKQETTTNKSIAKKNKVGMLRKKKN